jgi:hypothetical protein
MDAKAVHDVYYYLTERKIPEDLRGNQRKNQLKKWKRWTKKIEVRKKEERKEMTLENSTLLIIRRGKFKIIVRKSELGTIWKKFHVDRGHLGMLLSQE